MNKNNFYKRNYLELFINKNENFMEKHILFIDLDKKYYFNFFNNEKDLNFEIIYLSGNFKKFNSLNSLFEKYLEIKFEYVFLINKNFERNQIKSGEIEELLIRLCNNGAKIFIDLKNNQTLKKYVSSYFIGLFKTKKYLKQENLFINKQVLLYDYLYSNLSLFDSYDNNKKFFWINTVLEKLLNFIDNQRFYFLTKSLFVKYYYVKSSCIR